MKTFKTVLHESEMAAMPPALLHAKTSAIIQDSGYDHSKRHSSMDAKVFHHEYDPDRHGDDESDEHRFYYDYGPTEGKTAHEDKLHELGWSHDLKHDTYFEHGDHRFSAFNYSHPNGSSLTMIRHEKDGDNPVYQVHLRHPGGVK